MSLFRYLTIIVIGLLIPIHLKLEVFLFNSSALSTSDGCLNLKTVKGLKIEPAKLEMSVQQKRP